VSELNASEELPPSTPEQDAAYETLVQSGVTGLPTHRFGTELPLWAHPLLWFSMAMGTLLLAFLLYLPDSGVPRRMDELLVLPNADGDIVWFFPIMLLPAALPLLVYAIASSSTELLTLQLMGNVKARLPRVFAVLLRGCLAGSTSWPGVRLRFSTRVIGLALLLPVFFAHGLFTLKGTYRAVHLNGIREVTPTHLREFDWSEVTRIRARCRLSESGWNWSYELVFRSGDEFNLIRSDHRGLDLVGRIDRMLAEMRVPKRGERPRRIELCTRDWPREAEHPLLREVLGGQQGADRHPAHENDRARADH